MNRTICLTIGMLLLISPKSASADIFTYLFVKETSNGPVNENFASQLSLEVWDDSELGVSPGQVLFKFNNDLSGTGINGTLSQIYWDDSTNVLSQSISPFMSTHLSHTQDHQSGAAAISYSLDTDIGNSDKPPGVASWGNGVTDFNFDADNAAQSGIEQREMGGFFFELNGATFQDLKSAIDNGDLRVAIHGQSVGATANSDSFVNSTTAVPEPNTPTAILIMAVTSAIVRRNRV